ncbi:hypothetical protein ACIB24_12590 [Spongisporangium articulatum]|uniref:Integral membrane protein n=1 Tax=Spongisporangium articulatum TaxID=3362603 RepID=A0ABW8APP2_9ACTN
MFAVLTWPLLAACLLGAGWSVATAVRDARPSNRLLVVLLVAEVLTLAQLVAGVAAVATTDRSVSVATFVSYAAALPFIIPVGAVWSSMERSRSSTLVITLACVAVGVMTLRMAQIWSGHA